ncbi:MAG: hypothetical protein ACLGXA_05475 [Acidobacteriota bacterium]
MQRLPPLKNHTKVIFCSGQPIWQFYDCVLGGKNVIEEWYRKLSDEASFTFSSLLKTLQKIDSQLQWPGFKFLKGKLKEERIWQLDFIADKRQHRVLGVFGQGRKSAVLILGCYHKGDNYTPSSALETARLRAKALGEGRAQLHERQIRTDI